MQTKSAGNAQNYRKYIPSKPSNPSLSALSLLHHGRYYQIRHFKIETVNQLATKQYKKIHSKLQSHSNHLIAGLASNSLPINPLRRLNRKWCELLNDLRLTNLYNLIRKKKLTLGSVTGCLDGFPPRVLLYTYSNLLIMLCSTNCKYSLKKKKKTLNKHLIKFLIFDNKK